MTYSSPKENSNLAKDMEMGGEQNCIRLTAEEAIAYWNALAEPPKLTQAQRELGLLMRGEKPKTCQK